MTILKSIISTTLLFIIIGAIYYLWAKYVPTDKIISVSDRWSELITDWCVIMVVWYVFKDFYNSFKKNN